MLHRDKPKQLKTPQASFIMKDTQTHIIFAFTLPHSNFSKYTFHIHVLILFNFFMIKQFVFKANQHLSKHLSMLIFADVIIANCSLKTKKKVLNLFQGYISKYSSSCSLFDDQIILSIKNLTVSLTFQNFSNVDLFTQVFISETVGKNLLLQSIRKI